MSEAQRILVIEDDAILRELLVDWFEAAGYRVCVANEGASGIARALVDRPDLVVTDMCMPGAGGATVISEVTSLFPGVPVIAISAHFGSGQGCAPEEALRLGAACTLAKPFKRKDMVGSVIDLVGPPAG
jgi:CheY-like chemotaxis protein